MVWNDIWQYFIAVGFLPQYGCEPAIRRRHIAGRGEQHCARLETTKASRVWILLRRSMMSKCRRNPWTIRSPVVNRTWSDWEHHGAPSHGEGSLRCYGQSHTADLLFGSDIALIFLWWVLCASHWSSFILVLVYILYTDTNIYIYIYASWAYIGIVV